MKHQYAVDPTDTLVTEGNLEGEGRWIYFYEFEDKTGNHYKICLDQDGDEKIVEVN